ncbi:MAG: carbohydrate binding domain-containing protein, partial [Pseudodesulfovibrio sp.]|nr:carbohydrate binding domain-containing protein [Pseudodesulfovibrio sp.]
TLDASNTVVEKSLGATNMVQVPGGSGYYINGNFETLGAGGADVFAGWYEIAGDGAIASDTGHYGTYSVKLTAGAAGNAQVSKSNLAVTGGTSYYISFWTKGDGTNAGGWYVYFAAGGQNTGTISTGATGADWVKKQIVLKATVNTTLSFGAQSPATEGGIAYFDDVELREVLDGAELLDDPGFDDAGAWTAGTGWSVADGVAAFDGSGIGTITTSVSGRSDVIYRLNSSLASTTGKGLYFPSGSTNIIHGRYLTPAAAGSYTVFAPPRGTQYYQLYGFNGFAVSADYVSAAMLYQSSCFSTARLPGASKVRTTPVVAGSELAGAVMCLDDRDSPANFVVAYIDPSWNYSTNRLLLWKCVAGVWTLLTETNITYSAGAPLELRRVNDVFSVYYNGSQVGASQTVAGMTGNYHGIFATGSTSTFGELKIQ